MVVGLTGGVATGKSLVAGEFERLGAAVVDADAIARRLTEKDTPVYREIVREFGARMVLDDGSIDRRALGRAVFSNPGKRRRLNEITHPEIIREIRRRIEELRAGGGKGLIVVNAPLLFEAGLERDVDRVIVVRAERFLQIERMKRRDGLTDVEARERIDAQMPIEEKAALADFIISNNGTREETLERARGVYRELEKA